jgi:pSer/pThr/pTyr-binding forkhead associated (FHA) protein
MAIVIRERLSMWVLTLHSPSSEPREYLLPPGKTTLGRQPENHLVIPDESASRAHAEIEYQAETNTLTLYDLGSTNGTFVNRERCAGWRRLRPGDQIRIGQHILNVAFYNAH